MAGQGVVAQLSGLIQATSAEQTAQIQAAVAAQGAQVQAALAELNVQFQETNARLDSIEKQLDRIWTLLVLIVATLFATLTILVTTLLLRG